MNILIVDDQPNVISFSTATGPMAGNRDLQRIYSEFRSGCPRCVIL